MDLFEYSKGKTDTSQQARKSLEPTGAVSLRERVFDEIKQNGGRTPSEIAQDIQASILNVRPRTSELKITNRIADSGERRKNRNNKNEIVWVAVDV